jgi:hypothetical protein
MTRLLFLLVGLAKEYASQHGDAIGSFFHYVKKRVRISD